VHRRDPVALRSAILGEPFRGTLVVDSWGGHRVNRRTWYDLLATVSLALAGVGAILAAAGAVLQQVISVAAATLCTLVSLVPGLYFLAYARRLSARDLALAHAAAYATARG